VRRVFHGRGNHDPESLNLRIAPVDDRLAPSIAIGATPVAQGRNDNAAGENFKRQNVGSEFPNRQTNSPPESSQGKGSDSHGQRNASLIAASPPHLFFEPARG
jgi:hypothetical protein